MLSFIATFDERGVTSEKNCKDMEEILPPSKCKLRAIMVVLKIIKNSNCSKIHRLMVPDGITTTFGGNLHTLLHFP